LNGKDSTDNVLERLAALEHEQWAHWTRHMLDNLYPENIERWKRQVETPYEELTEKEKDSDREWASKILSIVDPKNLELWKCQICGSWKIKGEKHCRRCYWNHEEDSR